MSITLSKTEVPLGAVLTCKLANVSFEWGEKTNFPLNAPVSLTSSHSISRHVARLHPTLELYPSNILHRTEVDHWLTLSCGPLGCRNDISDVLNQLNNALAPTTFLTSGKLTIADLEVFAALYKCKEWQEKLSNQTCPKHVLRWFNHTKNRVDPILSSFPEEVKSSLCFVRSNERESSLKREDGGKFVELPGAKMGEVVVRFPPEASGYLHIGHAKAALLNQYYQKAFKGKLIMRFDDTNPDKEKADFEKVILEDLKLLDVQADRFTFTSDYFNQMLCMCEGLLKKGLAYVDNTEAELMKKEREERKESKNRNNSVDLNMQMWGEMKKGTPKGQTCCVRAKIDMNSGNGCMRDPTIYRCKNEPHLRTKDKFKVYPTYDFACPIVDSVEGVTHALRTTEYHDRDEQYYWFIKNLGLRSLHIYEYSRLNMNNTVLSKRKLTWFVEQGLVDGWDDPRFPTVRGIIRRGMTVEGLKDFIIAQGSSRSVVNMEWDKIWSFNKKVIDKEASRCTALEGELVCVTVRNAKEESKEAQKHPKDVSKGIKMVWLGPQVYIEAVDAAELKEGQNATFINWGNLKITKIQKENGTIKSVEAEPNLSDTDFKKTLKVTWLSQTVKAPWTPLVCSYFDHIINKSVLGKDEDFKNFVNQSTRKETAMLGDDDMKKLKEGDIIQIQRKGFFRVDEAYKPFSAASCKESPVVLFYIPDGHSKEPAVVPSKQVAGLSTKEVKQSAKGKQAEKSPQDEAKPIVSSGNKAIEIHDKIKTQGDVIRKLKAEKADKSVIMPAVDTLKSLKAEFKEQTGTEWTPDIDITKFGKPTVSTSSCPTSDVALQLHGKITEQGNKIRDLKGSKADKNIIQEQVLILIAHKKEFKEKVNVDWKPDIDINSIVKGSTPNSQESKANNVPAKSSSGDATTISSKIKEQGDKVRSLKVSKADKDTIKGAVNILLALKEEFKSVSGLDWKPDMDLPSGQKPTTAVAETPCASSPALQIHNKIKEQGDQVRSLKSQKADKETVTSAVNILLTLKKEFKEITNLDWKPDIDTSLFSSQSAPTAAKPAPTAFSPALEIHNKIKDQGEKVRSLKSQKADKETVMSAVNILLTLKKEFKVVTNIDWKPDVDTSLFSSQSAPTAAKSAPAPAKSAPKSASKESKRPKAESKSEESGGKKQTRLGLEAAKETNLPDWYSQVITKSEMIEYYNVSGCYILRPWSYGIWEMIKDFFDKKIKTLGVENAYFPMFVSKEALEKEKTHIADFSPEVAWVTRSGSSELAEPVAIRPTSETVMYPAFAKWIQSHRDLPIKINQWNNVVRWEFKQPTPFLRTREFLWQEGHTAHATKKDACDEVYTILEFYAQVYEDLLAIPVVRGHKTKKEQFAGGDFTTTTEAYISASGRAIQGATSHHLGQNFSKMFDIIFEDPKTQEKQFVFQNSWGLTTRTIGVMVMVHGDNKGLVLPPFVAPLQVVIMPVGITTSSSEEDRNSLIKYCTELEKDLKDKEIRTRCDFRDNVTPAWKFNHWELKGVPIRIEVGPREIANRKVFAVRRDNGDKQSLDREFIDRRVYNLLETIHKDMYAKAKVDLDSHKIVVHKWDDFVSSLNGGNLMLAPFCGVEECEDAIKKDSARDEPSEAGAPSMGAKGLCIPFEQPGKVDGLECIHPKCSNTPKFYTLFGRSY